MSDMSTNRIHHLGAVGLVVAVSLLLALAVRVGLTAAATGTPGLSSSGVQGAVTIHLWGPGLTRGRFTISGAIADRGRFVNDSYVGPGRGVHILFGAKGTIRITVGQFESWRITKGTKAYAGLHGRGRGRHHGGNQFSMWGTVSQ